MRQRLGNVPHGVLAGQVRRHDHRQLHEVQHGRGDVEAKGHTEAKGRSHLRPRGDARVLGKVSHAVKHTKEQLFRVVVAGLPANLIDVLAHVLLEIVDLRTEL